MKWYKHLKWINFRKLYNWIVGLFYPTVEKKGICFWNFKHRIAHFKGYGFRCKVCWTPNQKCKGDR